MTGSGRSCGSTRLCGRAATTLRPSRYTFRTTSHSDVLLSIDQKRDRWTHLSKPGREFQEFFSGIGSKDQKLVIHRRKHQVAGGRQASAGEGAGARSCYPPPFFPCNWVPGKQNVSGSAIGTDGWDL
jgi:hypothetical protein